MKSRAPNRIRGRRRLTAVLAAIAGLVAFQGTALAGTGFLSGPFGNAPGGLRFDGNATTNVAQIGWTGPAVQPGTDPAYFVQEHNPAQPGGQTLTAQSPCSFAGAAPAPFAHQNRVLCPVQFQGQTVTSYTVRLGGGNNILLICGPGALGPSGPIQGPLTNGLASGGSGPDKIESHCPTTADRIFGGGGNDIIRVTGGRSFYPGGVHNIVRGGAGSDRLETFLNGERDRVFCDSGLHDYAKVDLRDIVADPQRCATIERAPKDQHPTLKVLRRAAPVRGGRAAVRLRCPRQVKGGPCRGRLTIKKGRRTVGARRYRVRKGGTRVVRVRVGRARGAVRVIATDRGSDGRPKTTTVRLRLRG